MARQVPWIRIGAEGIAIIVSILLAFGIQAWWESAQDRRSETRALELIHGDLLADTVDLGAAERTAERHLAAAVWILDRWDDPLVDLDSLAAALGDFLSWPVVQPQRAAYTGLRDGNGLTLIQNDTLRAAIVKYFEEVQVNLVQRRDRAFSEREALSDLLAPHIRWPDTERDAQGRLVMSIRLVSPWPEMRSDNRIAFQLAAMRGASASSGGSARAAIGANSDLRAMIEAELGAGR